MLPQEKTKYTLEEYLELDHESEENSEFWNGKIWAIENSYLKYATIKGNIIFNIGKVKRSRNKVIEIFPNLRI